MKALLVLSFYLPAIAFVSGIVLREPSLLLQPQGATTQNQSQKVFLLNPQARGGPAIGNLVYLKHLMELRCLKRVMEDIRNKSRLRNHQSHKPLEVSLTQNLQNQISNVKKTGLNPSEIQNRVKPGNNQIIILPYKDKFLDIYKFLKNKEFQSIGRGVVLSDKWNNFNEKRQKSIFIQPPLYAFERRKKNEYFPTENFRFLPDKNKGSSEGTKNRYQTKQPNNVKSSPTTASVGSHRARQQVKWIRPYGLEASISDDQKNRSDLKNHQQYNLESPLLNRKQGKKTEELKPSGTNSDNEKSDSKNFETSANSGNSSSFSLKEILINSHPHTNQREMYSDSDFSDLEQTTENKLQVNPQERNKQLEIPLQHSSEMIEKSNLQEPEIETDSTSATKVENFKKVFAIKVTNAPVLKSRYLMENETKNSVENIKRTATVPEIRPFTLSEFPDMPNVIKNQVTDTSTTLPFIPTEGEMKEFTGEQTITVKESSSNFLFISSKSETTAAGLAISEFPKKNSGEKTAQSLENAKEIEMETDSPEQGLTKLISTEFTDHPLTGDFLIANKKEQETFGKNSRKMHFNHKFPPTAAPDYITQPNNSEQRRSDILIDDLEDYYLQESVFSSNYVKQLKQDNSLNSSSDFVIQLIPLVINDLRENKISSEDLPVLSKAFGGYWPTVLTLTNSTNLDMLPLLKMKNEKDLNVILSTFFPDGSDTNSTESKEAELDKVQAYYYQDDYTDLSMEQRDYWKNEETFKTDLEDL